MFCGCFILTLFFSYSLDNIIIFPFKNTRTFENNVNENNFFFNFIPQNYITEISIGTPSQEMNIQLTLRDYRFYIANNICYNNSISYYNYSQSSSFNHISPATSPFDDLADASFVSDKVSFYNDINLNKNISIEKFKFYFYQTYRFKENTKIFCGVIGLSINRENYDLDYFDDDYYLPTIFQTLKNDDYITKYSWTYEYFDKTNYKNNIIKNKSVIDNYDGLLIIGKYPHEYNPDLYSGHYLNNIYSDKDSYKFLWNFAFTKIYYDIYNNKEESIINLNQTQVELLFDINYIISTKEYYDSINENYFNFYINKNICNINNMKFEFNEYEIISCFKENFTINDKKKFPSIYFRHVEFNYTFFLNYDELFEENDNQIYFLIYFLKSNNNLWKFGKLFLKKFQFSFNQDSSTIHFYSDYDKILSKRKNEYKDNSNGSNKKYIKILIVCICIFIFSVVLGIFIGKIIGFKKEKKKADELEENFEYFTQNENINNNDI